jgi:hypothetical protein
MVFAGPAYGADELKPQQLRLIDDWIVRYEKVSGRSRNRE